MSRSGAVKEEAMPRCAPREAVPASNPPHISVRVPGALTFVRGSVALLLALVVVTLAGAASAAAAAPGFIYWSNEQTARLGRANIDGTGVNQGFIAGAQGPGVAVDSKHVYWTNRDSNTIGRANLDGSDVNQRFISGVNEPYSLAVDSQHIYWGTFRASTIGRANLDGSGVAQGFIAARSPAHGIAVDGNHIYWSHGSSIGRANLDGSGVNQAFIANLPYPEGVGVDASHIYFAPLGNFDYQIARANLDGSNVNLSFLKVGQAGPVGMTVVNGHIYWVNLDSDYIGVANSDGTGILKNFIPRADEGGPAGIAVTGSALPRASASATKLDFGTHPLQDFGRPKTVTITDTGTAPLSIANAELSGPNRGDFLINADTCSGNVIRPQGSCQISVLFGPSALGARSAALDVPTDDPGSSRLSITLAGTGVAQAIGGTPPNAWLTCRTPKTPVVRTHAGKRRRVVITVARCTARLVRAMGRFRTAEAILARDGVTYASGRAARIHGPRVRLQITERRRLRSGVYSLTLRYRANRRWTRRGLRIQLTFTRQARPRFTG
jgi:virginiamycin B lyase